MRKIHLMSFGVVLLLGISAQAATVVITPTAGGNWTYTPTSACASTTTTESTSFVNGPGTPPLGLASLQMNIGTNGDSAPRWWLSGWSGTRLDSLTALGYSTYVQQYVDSQAIYLRLYLDLDGDNVADDDILFEPAYQSVTYMPSFPQAALTTGTWQTWDALHGGWWSNNGNCSADPGSNVKTIAQYLVCYPNARIMDTAPKSGVSLQAGCGSPSWDNFIGNVDGLMISTGAGTTTYDFEQFDAPISVPILSGLALAALCAALAAAGALKIRR